MDTFEESMATSSCFGELCEVPSTEIPPDTSCESPNYIMTTANEPSPARTFSSPSSQSITADTGKTALHLAAETGNVSTVKIPMSISADLHSQDSNGRTALHLAVESGHENAVAQLITEPSHIDRKNKNGETALHAAVSMGAHKIVTMLLEAGCAVDMTDKHGRTALHSAVLGAHDLIILLLVQKGADVEARVVSKT